MNIILQGVVGSTAYGLAGPDSDEDRLGIFLAPTSTVLGLDGPEAVKETRKLPEGDSAIHELGKYLSLALRCNPTVLELMWLPTYEIETPAATALIAQRQYFLSEKYVRSAYGGYARQQADRLLQRHKEGKEGFSSDIRKRTAKHARHCIRLLVQGEQLLKTGEITVDVSQYRDTLFQAGDIAARDPKKFYGVFEKTIDYFDRVQSTLPQQPDREKINSYLVKVRQGEL